MRHFSTRILTFFKIRFLNVLQLCVLHPDPQVQQLLDSGFDVNTEFKSGWTLVMYASEGAQPEVMLYRATHCI